MYTKSFTIYLICWSMNHFYTLSYLGILVCLLSLLRNPNISVHKPPCGRCSIARRNLHFSSFIRVLKQINYKKIINQKSYALLAYIQYLLNSKFTYVFRLFDTKDIIIHYKVKKFKRYIIERWNKNVAGIKTRIPTQRNCGKRGWPLEVFIILGNLRNRFSLSYVDFRNATMEDVVSIV